MNALRPMLPPPVLGRYTGLAVASSLLAGWVGLQAVGLFWLDLATPLGQALAMPLLLSLTWHTAGLFITAHEAIHGLVVPNNQAANDAIGRVMVTLVAFLSYRALQDAHHVHHDAVGTVRDPDGPGPIPLGFLPWMIRFFRHYVGVGSVVGMAVWFNLLLHGAQVPLGNVLLCTVAAPLLSALQLFTFGTYLPHVAPQRGWGGQLAARSVDFPGWLSLITCFHFGYHREHHAYPWVAWWQLPAARAWSKRHDPVVGVNPL